MRLLAVALCLVATGCASTLSRTVALDEAGRGDGWTRVENVSEVRQRTRDGCGAAALAMVLGHWGRAVSQDDILGATSPTHGAGLRADVLRDFARGQDLDAYVIEGGLDDLEREVARDRPVVVGVMRREGRWAFKHYEVVVGVNRQQRRVLTLDPARGPVETRLEQFTAEWDASGRVTLVVLPRTLAGASGASP